MSLEMIILSVGLLTYALRASFVVLLGSARLPAVLRRAARFVPVAVISAIVFPDLIYRRGALDVSLDNHRLLIGLIAFVVAWRTKNVLLTLGIGMSGLWLLQALVH